MMQQIKLKENEVNLISLDGGKDVKGKGKLDEGDCQEQKERNWNTGDRQHIRGKKVWTQRLNKGKIKY